MLGRGWACFLHLGCVLLGFAFALILKMRWRFSRMLHGLNLESQVGILGHGPRLGPLCSGRSLTACVIWRGTACVGGVCLGRGWACSLYLGCVLPG